MRDVGKKIEVYRVVIDTNVYISMFVFPDRPLRRLLDAAQERVYQLVVSPAIVSEFARILRDRFRVPEDEVIDHIKHAVHVAEVVVPQEVPPVILEDPADDAIVACALSGGVDLIVSGDKDLLRLKEYRGIPIIRAVDFLRMLDGM